ncbi:MAG: hypothetical protein IH614_06160 [Desulfuromonadales bacterium]|nr:hypothetical protein [Desulfuromonadales bacterium]
MRLESGNEKMWLRATRGTWALLLAASLVACGGDDNDRVPPPGSVGGAVSGLVGNGLVLQNNGGDDLSIDADGPFAFSALLASGADYAVTVKSHPSAPSQTCTVNDGTGKFAGAEVTSVTIICATDSYAVSGVVSGLTGRGLVLQNNAGDDLPIDVDGAFTFATAVASGAAYTVSVKSQPTDPEQTCTVNDGTGQITDAEVTGVAVVCATNSYAIGGTVSGLTGSGLVLQNNAGDDLSIDADGAFLFATPVASGAGYAVTVKMQPSSMPAQACLVSNAAGKVISSAVTVAVECGPAYILPTTAISISLGPRWGLVADGRAYLIEGSLFKVLDVRDPLSPSLLGTVTHGYPDLRVEPHAVRDNTVWVIRSSSGGHGLATHLSGVDVSDPANPVLRGTLTLQTESSLLSNASLVYSGHLLIHDYSRNLIYVIDISDPDAPTVFSQWSVPNMVNGGPGIMMIDGTLLYLPSGENGTLRIYNLSDLAAVAEVGNVGLGAECQSTAVKIGRYVYTTAYRVIYAGGWKSVADLKVVDVADPTHPIVVTTVEGLPAGRLKERNGRLFSFDYDTPTVRAYSLVDPANPLQEASATVAVPAPSSNLVLYYLTMPSATWVGDYLLGITYGSATQYHGLRALDFQVR